MDFWIKHPRSEKKDAMLTVAMYSTFVVLLKFFVSGVVVGSVNLGSLDAASVAAILTPTLGAYCWRKQKDSPDKEVSEDVEK